MTIEEILEAQQRMIEELSAQRQVIEARGGPGDKEAAEELRVKLHVMQRKLDRVKARQRGEEPSPLDAIEKQVLDAEARDPFLVKVRRFWRRLSLVGWLIQIAVIAAILAAAALVALPIARMFGWMD